jgi:GAF domain-containing protein
VHPELETRTVVCEVHTAPALLSARPRELEALSALITRVTSTLDMDEVLDHATGVCSALTGCAGALVYLWDEEQDRLVIRGASDGYQRWIGTFSLRLGEGLTGWTALNRRPGIITDDPLSDPRYKYVPELNDSRFQSTLTVPVVGREDALVGVLTLHTTAPHEFTDDDVRLIRAVAGLIAGAVENARLHERALRAATVFRRLADASNEMTSASPGPRTLQRLALTALELLDAMLVAVLVLDEARGRLVVETWVGGDGGAVHADGVRAEGLWARLLGGGPTSSGVDGDEPFVRTLGLRVPPRSLFTAPLVFDGRPIGLLVCTAHERRTLGPDNLELLGVIANHTAIALEESRSAAEADERSRVRSLFDTLRSGDPLPDAGASLGLRLDAPHAVVCVEANQGSGAERLFRSVAVALGDVFPGSLAEPRGSELALLVPLRSERWEELLERTLETAMADSPDARAGFSDSTAETNDFALGFRQARVASAIAAGSGARRRIRSHRGLGAQRYLWAISKERDPDPLELAVGRLIEIDERRGSDLFNTLETYLDHQGNARQTAAALYIHRNTLRLRLRRIAELVGLDPTDRNAWLDLVLAVRLIRFRALADA